MKVIICSHHRCGTVLLRNAFRHFAQKTGRSFHKTSTPPPELDSHITQNTLGDQWQWASYGNFKGLHLFRDPYDMLLSHIRYHEQTKSPDEACNKILVNGVLYRSFLGSLGSLEEKAKFEIENIFGRTFRKMLNWDYTDERFLNVNLDEFQPSRLEPTVEKVAKHFEFCAGDASELFGAFQLSNRVFTKKSAHITRQGDSPARQVLGPEIGQCLVDRFELFPQFMNGRELSL